MSAKNELELHHIEAEDIPYMQREHGTYKNFDIPTFYTPDYMSKQKWSALLLLMIGLYGIGFALIPH